LTIQLIKTIYQVLFSLVEKLLLYNNKQDYCEIIWNKRDEGQNRHGCWICSSSCKYRIIMGGMHQQSFS